MPFPEFIINILGTILVTIISFLILGFLMVKYRYTYWARRNVPYLEPSFPRGNMPKFSLRKASPGTDPQTWYHAIRKRGLKYAGVWYCLKPVLVVVDPGYIRDILLKDFSYFTDRVSYVNKIDDPLSNHLVNISGEDGWKNLRQKLTPTFSSGKMKTMFDSVLRCCNPMVDAIEKMALKNQDVSILDMLLGFTVDVIANVAFGVDCNSFDGSPNVFKSMSKPIQEVPLERGIKTMFIANFPDLAKKMRINMGRKVYTDFFTKLVDNSIKHREENNISRPDFLQLLIDMKNKTASSDDPFTYDQVRANTGLFFIAGFDTSSTTMNFTLFELAKHPDIQEKVRTEINTVLARYERKLTYESLLEMTYLRQVMDESMRLHPAAFTLSRKATRDYKLRDTDIVLEKGTQVFMSITGIHMDPEHYPDPEKFDPERFTAENKAKRDPFVNLSFGEGPRNCIGMRFGLMQSTIGLASILRKFRVEISPLTKLPLTPNPNLPLLKSNETLYLKIQKI